MYPIHVMIDKQQAGPFPREELEQKIAQGTVTPRSLAWRDGLADWQPLIQIAPELFPAPPVASGAPPVATAPAAMAPGAPPVLTGPGKIKFEVLRSEFWQMPKITLENSQVIVESGALHYMRGNLLMEAQAPTLGGFFKAKLTGEHAVRPRYSGTGEVFLEPTFGEVNTLELKGDGWILDRGAFLAADVTVEVGMMTNRAWSGFLGGEGFFQTTVAGHGTVLFHSDGPLERIELKGERLVVDGAFAVARSPSLEFRIERAAKGLFATMASGEGRVNTFQGHGVVLIAPLRNRSLTVLREFGTLRAQLASMRTAG